MSGRMSIQGHRTQFAGKQRSLRRSLKNWQSDGCGGTHGGGTGYFDMSMAFRLSFMAFPWPAGMGPGHRGGRFALSPWHVVAVVAVVVLVVHSGGAAAPLVVAA